MTWVLVILLEYSITIQGVPLTATFEMQGFKSRDLCQEMLLGAVVEFDSDPVATVAEAWCEEQGQNS